MLEQQDQEQDRQPEFEIVDQESETEVDAEPLSGTDDDHGDDDAIADEVVVSIGDEQPPEEKPAPRWVKELRKSQRELARENRELKARLESTASTETKPVQLGPKPTLDSCEYDSERYEAELAAWFERKRDADQAEQRARDAQEAQERDWRAKLDAYGKAKAELKVRDYDEAEDAVQSLFDVTQQGVMLEGAENPALLVYALGKSPSKAKELAAIKSPVKFAFAIAKLEKELKVSTRTKQAPAPEKTVSGTARISGSVDSNLERLREEAARTGDISKVVAYKRQLKLKSKQR
jgi:hypothetical protein